jgi:hypothetical protein
VNNNGARLALELGCRDRTMTGYIVGGIICFLVVSAFMGVLGRDQSPQQ